MLFVPLSAWFVSRATHTRTCFSSCRQWLLLLEGLPSVLMGIALWFFLPETPENWSWLSREQQELFQADVSVLWSI